TALEPVNVTAFTASCWISASPSWDPGPVTTLKTPGGIPASSKTEAMASAVKGASAAGFRTTVLPKIRAGHDFHKGMATGKFQGVMTPTTPKGSRTVNISAPGAAEGMTWPRLRQPSPA